MKDGRLSDLLSPERKGPGSDSAPDSGATKQHPACERVADPTAEGFLTRAQLDLERIIPLVNLHSKTHRSALGQSTCLRPDGSCRFDFPQELVAQFMLEDGHLRIQRLDQWVNAWNHILAICLRCNLDIKLILSGRDCKAVVMYVCNYITKKLDRNYNLNAAIEAALRSLEEEERQKGAINDPVERSRKMLIKCVNKANALLEKSGPEVAAFLLGCPSAYCSHKFNSVYFVCVLRFAEQQYALLRENPDSKDSSLHGLDDFVLEVDGQGNPSLGSSLADLIWRPECLRKLCLYELTALGRRVPRGRPRQQLAAADDAADADDGGPAEVGDDDAAPMADDPHHDEPLPSVDELSAQIDGPLPFSDEHPQKSTHWYQRFRQPRIPVVIGPAFPSRQTEAERFGMLACMLFVPWTSIRKLVMPEQRLLSWSEAFQRAESHLSPEMQQKLKNIEALHEGRSQVQAERLARQRQQQEQKNQQEQQPEANAQPRFDVTGLVPGLGDAEADELPELDDADASLRPAQLTLHDIVTISNAEKTWTEQGLRYAMAGGVCAAVPIPKQQVF